MLSVVAPANAAVATGLVASVGPNGETSLTVVGGADSTTAALVRLDVTSNDTATAGLSAGESVTGTLVGVPSGVTAKTLAANGGSLADSTTSLGVSGYSDFYMIESTGQTQGSLGATAADATSGSTDWSLLADSVTGTYQDSAAAGTSVLANDGMIGSVNTGFRNMDSVHEITGYQYTKSYYVTLRARNGANVVDKGAYTFQFQLTDANGIVRATKTVKIDFVSAASKSDAALTIAQSGNFVANTAIKPYDTQTGASAGAYVKLTLKNRDGGLVRTSAGAAPAPTMTIQWSRTSSPAYVDTITASLVDDGAYGTDFGTDEDANRTGTLQKFDGVYGATFTSPIVATSTTTGDLRSYQFWAGYGNASIQTSALTVYSGTATATYTKTDAIVTAAGMSAANQLLISNDADASYTWTVPTSTTSGSIKFYIQDGSDAGVGAADITVTPTWSGSFGTSTVTPATSTTGTVYTTDSSGLITVSFTNTAPVAGASLALALTGAKAFGNNRYVATITWAKPTATTIAVADPISGVYVKTGSTNVTTVIVKDQFGNPVSGEAVTVALSSTSANYSSTTTIAPLTTGAAGTATYSLVGGATTATLDAITFTSVTSGATASMTYNYVSTVPAVAAMTGYYNLDWNSAATSVTTLVPATGIYKTGTTKLLIQKARNISASLTSFADHDTDDDMAVLRFQGLAAGSVAATGAVVTVTAGEGGWILDASGLPVKKRDFLVASTGYTGAIQVLATQPGAINFTATSGTVTATAAFWVNNATGDARFVKLSESGGVVTAAVTDRYGNGVAGVDVQISTSAGNLGNGQLTTVYKTDLAGKVAVVPQGSGDATITAIATTAGDYASIAGYVVDTIVDSTVAAGNDTATLNVSLATTSSSDALDAANEATDAANAATDAANAAAEAADAATAAAQDAQAAVAALATEVAAMISGIKAQIIRLTNLVVKIQKKVNA
jgi:hypothetical protein